MTTNEGMSVSDRQVAGRLLSKKLEQYANSAAIVLGIPRGGVIVASSVAEMLGLPLQVVPCRKLVHPGDSNRSIGSVSLEEVVLGDDCYDIPRDYISHQIVLLRNSLRSELAEYNPDQVPLSIRYKTVIVVDDVSRSGDTILACLRSVKKQKPLKLIVAVPFVSAKAGRLVGEIADEVVFLRMDHEIRSAKDCYHDFPDIGVRDVKKILNRITHEMRVS